MHATRIIGAMALAGGLLVSTPSPASADTERCVSANEYERIGGRAQALTRSQITEVFDIRGFVYQTKNWHGDKEIWVHYTPECGTDGLGGVTVHFKDYMHGDDRRFRLWRKWLTWH